jgi:hypothetical protein
MTEDEAKKPDLITMKPEQPPPPRGRSRGGIARAESLSADRRQEIARRAAAARWSAGPVYKATHGSADRPIRIGDMEIPCYVLEDQRRVLTLGGMVRALGMSIGGGSLGLKGDRLSRFVAARGLNPFVSEDLLSRTLSPVKFRVPSGVLATGYEATLLPDLCDAVLAARRAGELNKNQGHIANHCEILLGAFARVGIIALVDEATGYQKDRAADALARILEAWVAKGLEKWVKTFPTDYYEQMFRLRGLEYPNGSVKRPQYFGILTNEIVYRRLAPGVLTELKRVREHSEVTHRPKHKLFQRLTTNLGYPNLREHLGAVVAVMKLSSTWHDFMDKLNRLYPRFGDTIPLPLDYDQSKDDGQGL